MLAFARGFTSYRNPQTLEPSYEPSHPKSEYGTANQPQHPHFADAEAVLFGAHHVGGVVGICGAGGHGLCRMGLEFPAKHELHE